MLTLMIQKNKSGDKKISKKTEEQRQLIFDYLKINNTCSNAEVCNLLGVKESRARIILGQMVEDKLLVAEGEKKNRVYCTM